MSTNGVTVRIKGKVQGVGFRPAIWQLATSFNVRGNVSNDAAGIVIHLWKDTATSIFISKLSESPPPLAKIDQIEQTPYHWEVPPDDFIILPSTNGVMDTQITPDAATCEACLQELNTISDRRFHYPFINCTNCGPRFTIIEKMPYDRPNTVMQGFVLCEHCQKEYTSPTDRRFHAQPIACPDCGPHIWLCKSDGAPMSLADEAISQTIEHLAQGKIVAIKSLGGFHLICDATQEIPVKQLRQRKCRPSKPFAVMLPDAPWLSNCVAEESDKDRLTSLLTSPAAPIVLASKHARSPICHSVAPNVHEIGLMLPSNPLHHLLLQQWQKPLLMTSGNPPHKPTVVDNMVALNTLDTIADYYLLHDRPIVQRTDDSVIRLNNDGIETLRRARGYVPDTLKLPQGFEFSPSILALGADLKNTFCILNSPNAIVSQHFGGLDDLDTRNQWQQTLNHWLNLYQAVPQYIVVDAHPNYATQVLAEKYSQQLGIPKVTVLHHHAHVAACLAEYNYPLNAPPVIALTLDGLGYGQNAALWGGECLLVDYKQCQKLGGLPAVALPGADLAAKEPWRNLLAHLLTFVPDWQSRSEIENIPIASRQIILRAIQQHINCPLASSTGRLFDAIAAALNITPPLISWEGEAACQLEALALQHTGEEPTVTMPVIDMTLDLKSFWNSWLNWQAPKPTKAYGFHMALAKGFAQLAIKSAEKYQIKTIVLTGGVMHNKLLRKLLCQQLQDYQVLFPKHYPANDGGISLGQAVIIAAQYPTMTF